MYSAGEKKKDSFWAIGIGADYFSVLPCVHFWTYGYDW